MTESSSPASRVGTVTGPFASLGARFGAFVIDRMLLLAFVAPAAALFYVAFEDGSPGGRQLFFAGIPTLLTLILLIVQWVNLSRRGRTIGGFALGVSIVRGEGGTPLGFGKALLRTVVLQLISSIPLLVIVAMVLSAKHPRRQAWHDSVVGAVVVKATPESLVEEADRRAREAPIPMSAPPVMLDSSAPPVGLETGQGPAAPGFPAPVAPPSPVEAAPAPGLPQPPAASPSAPSSAPPSSPAPAAKLPPLPLPPPPVAPDADTRDLPGSAGPAPAPTPPAAPEPAPEPSPAASPEPRPDPAVPAAPVAPPAATPPTPPAQDRTPPPIGQAAPATPPPAAAGGRLITSVPGFGPAGDAPATPEAKPEPEPQSTPEPAPVVGRRRAIPAVEEEPLEAQPEPDVVDGATRVGQRRGARPTWILVGEDGRRIAVRSTVVVGRDPETGDHTGALPAAIPDPERSVSKTHAVLTVAGGALRVDDLHSTNGTHVLSHGVESAVQPGQPLEIQPGDTVWFGDRAFVAEHGG